MNSIYYLLLFFVAASICCPVECPDHPLRPDHPNQERRQGPGQPQLQVSEFSFRAGLWIRIRIGSGFSDFVDADPYWESVSRIWIQGQES
jgi:hypothetical protein